ncbi:phosphopentomutase-like [Babylonia areolata]|uniref:phosphopentomutase-like n=1 Tax=Babylonia areolata TaxID=304850 RepID=UPI003FD1F1B0
MAGFATGDSKVDTLLQQWFDWDKNEATRKEIKALAEKNDVKELGKRLGNRMEFGTAGLRAKMGAGYSMMNDLTIVQTAQGLIQYVLKANPKVKEKGIVVGFDGRYNSDKWAKISAAVCIANGIPVYLFSKVCPTPYVPFCIRHYGAACGVMVTASHNPKQDNGYKVYWENGAQIISPVDKGISKSIQDNLKPLESSWDISVVEGHPLCKDPYKDALKYYNAALDPVCYHREDNAKSSLRVVYTAMHGVGYPYVQAAFKAFSLQQPVPVEEQVEPDPEFPTVVYPNPEEGKGALSLSIKKADAVGSPVIIANDPDADRLALAEKLPSGEWKIFTGNELGALLGYWCWTSFRQQNPDVPGSDVYMLASTVSSKILQAIGTMEGFKFEETLTGFKWMGNRTADLIKEGKTVLFAFEEAIGYMCGTSVLDKDGVSAAAMITEFASQLYARNLTLEKQLEDIYTKYGYHLSSNSYFICHEPAVIARMFDELRNKGGEGKYPKTCGPYKISQVRDLTAGYDSSQPDKKPLLPVSKSSQMITFQFENGCVATLRTSGTEPKIKYYTEHCPDPSKGLDRAGAEQELEDIVHNIKKHFFQPEKFGLISRPDA